MLLMLPLLLLAFLPACAHTVPYDLQTAVHQLPAPGARIAVYELSSSGRTTPRAENEAAIWLQQQGLVVVERAAIDRLIEEQRFALVHDPASILRAGEFLGASEVVFVETDLNSAYLRSVDVQSGQILWSASAGYERVCAHMSARSDLQYRCFGFNLIRPALAAVWEGQPTRATEARAMLLR